MGFFLKNTWRYDISNGDTGSSVDEDIRVKFRRGLRFSFRLSFSIFHHTNTDYPTLNHVEWDDD